MLFIHGKEKKYGYTSFEPANGGASVPLAERFWQFSPVGQKLALGNFILNYVVRCLLEIYLSLFPSPVFVLYFNHLAFFDQSLLIFTFQVTILEHKELAPIVPNTHTPKTSNNLEISSQKLSSSSFHITQRLHNGTFNNKPLPPT